MKLKVFIQPNCPKCPVAKEFAEKIKDKIEVSYYDIDTPDGLAEAAMHGVMSTPSLVLVNNEDDELEIWRGKLPKDKEFKAKIIYYK